MANLFDTVKNNRSTYKQGGELQDSSQEELQKLSGNAGMPTTPSSPLSAFGIGANPDQAKMLGTPAQQGAAINIATQPGMDLQTQIREAQARKEQNAQEAAEQQRALSFEGFGSLGDRVQQIATKMFNGQTAAIAATQVADRAKFADHLAKGADPAQTEALLNKVGDGSATNQDILQIAKNLGYKDVTDIKALTESIKTSFLSNAENEANFTANTIPDNAKVSDFTPEQVQQLGFSDINAMAAALQVDPDVLSGMSIKDLQNQFGKEQMEDFGKVAAAQATLADASTSRAEKEAALKQLRELGATGVRAVEGDVKRLEDQVANGDLVKFNGQEYRMEDLLKSDTITGIVKGYLVDDDIAKSIQLSEPAFAQWIENNKKVLATAADRSSAKVDDFKAVQDANMALQQPNAGVHLDTSVMKLMFPDWGHLAATSYNAPPVLDVIKTRPVGDGQAIAGTMADLNTTVPTAAKGMVDASADQYARTGVDTKDGVMRYSDYAHTTTDLMAIDHNDDTAIKGRIFPGVPLETFAKVGNDAGVLESFGLSLDHSKLDIVTSNSYTMRNKYLQQAGGYNNDGTPLTVAQMAQFSVDASNFRSGGEILSSVRAQLEAKAKDPLFVKFGQYWAGGNDLKTGDAAKLGDNVIQQANTGEYQDLRKLADTAKMNGESKRILNEKLSKTGEVIAQKRLEQIGGYADRGQWDADLQTINSNITQDQWGDWQIAGNIKPTLDKMRDTLGKMQEAKKSDSSLQGWDIQNHTNWRIDQMQKAIDNYDWSLKMAGMPGVSMNPMNMGG